MGQFHWDPGEYDGLMRAEIPSYGRLQREVVAATAGLRPTRILDLGTGTGVTAAAVLEAHDGAELTGIDASTEMLQAAAVALAGRPVSLATARLEEPLPAGPWGLVTSALAVHHLDSAAKADLFVRVRDVLTPAGVFVLADVVVPVDPGQATTPLDPDIDRPDPVADQLDWLERAGLTAEVTWSAGDLAVLRAARR